ncbi:YajG family lipoprotein [Psychrobium sp. MM17-31]|uniref:YajG family lipoprotein n=1 Tax=Psychrobium sp. MM17-31 TaxID=2917758 RepID=UPI001EF68C19|nr:YajG family lipoprotein [Psychrobium sp. MM17-31]MCG7530992.1 YajG family lipoprotein [Psychrobium sp. MM17-31]
MKKLAFISLLAASIVGCSAAPSHFIVNTSPAITTNTPVLKNIAINVNDPRSRQAILRTTNDGKHSYMSAPIATTQLVKQGLASHFRQQLAVGLSPMSAQTLNITIDKMAMKLDQGLVSYEAQSLIVFNVSINNGTKTLTKSFKRQGTNKGPLKADIAVLESEFSGLLQQLYNDIAQDAQVKSYLNI